MLYWFKYASAKLSSKSSRSGDGAKHTSLQLLRPGLLGRVFGVTGAEVLAPAAAVGSTVSAGRCESPVNSTDAD